MHPKGVVMRVVQPQQMQLGEQAIAAIRIDTRSRDDIPKILQGLQHLYTRPRITQHRV